MLIQVALAGEIIVFLHIFYKQILSNSAGKLQIGRGRFGQESTPKSCSETINLGGVFVRIAESFAIRFARTAPLRNRSVGIVIPRNRLPARYFTQLSFPTIALQYGSLL